MLFTRVAVLQRKESVQIQISHSRCKHKKKSCEGKITGGPLTKCCILPLYYLHSIKKIFVPKCNKPDRENMEIQKKDWRKKTNLRQHFPAISVLSLCRPGRVWATELGQKSDSERSNLWEKQ